MNYLDLLIEHYQPMESKARLRWGIGLAAASFC